MCTSLRNKKCICRNRFSITEEVCGGLVKKQWGKNMGEGGGTK